MHSLIYLSCYIFQHQHLHAIHVAWRRPRCSVYVIGGVCSWGLLMPLAVMAETVDVGGRARACIGSHLHCPQCTRLCGGQRFISGLPRGVHHLLRGGHPCMFGRYQFLRVSLLALGWLLHVDALWRGVRRRFFDGTVVDDGGRISLTFCARYGFEQG